MAAASRTLQPRAVPIFHPQPHPQLRPAVPMVVPHPHPQPQPRGLPVMRPHQLMHVPLPRPIVAMMMPMPMPQLRPAQPQPQPRPPVSAPSKPESPKQRAWLYDGKDATLTKKKCCNCKYSRCLKLDCECFASGIYCDGCNCINCFNNVENEAARREA